MNLQIVWRRVRLQWSVSELEECTGLSKSTLYAAKNGKASERTMRILKDLSDNPKWPDDPNLPSYPGGEA